MASKAAVIAEACGNTSVRMYSAERYASVLHPGKLTSRQSVRLMLSAAAAATTSIIASVKPNDRDFMGLRPSTPTRISTWLAGRNRSESPRR